MKDLKASREPVSDGRPHEHDISVSYPERRRDDHPVARIEIRHECIKQDLLGTR